jgi:hypothetical protein
MWHAVLGFCSWCKPTRYGTIPIYKDHGNLPAVSIGGSTHDDR